MVELIIVIAIIAVLVAILAPQYLQYVEKSKVAADNSTADQILSAVKVAASDESVTLSPGIDTITWDHATSGSTLTVANATTPADVTTIENLLKTSMDITSFDTNGSAALTSAIKSSTYKSQKYVVTITVTATSGSDNTESVTANWQ